MSTPLGEHLHPYNRNKIWRGDYIDLLFFLFREPELKPWAGCGTIAHELEQYKHSEVKRNWNNWLSDYAAYMAVVIQAQPWRASSLIKYQDIVHRAYSFIVGSAWLRYYNEMF